MARARYVLTARAAADLREARVWSRARWGKDLTSRYFDDLHEGAQFIAENQTALRGRQELSGGTSLVGDLSNWLVRVASRTVSGSSGQPGVNAA